MTGYRSIDGACEVNLRLVVDEDLLSLWDGFLATSDELEPTLYDQCNDMYYVVRRFTKCVGDRYYRYKIHLIDGQQYTHYVILLDTKGGAKVEIHYAAQRDAQRLNLDYRKFFNYLGIKILQEQISRVDLAITIDRPASAIIRDVLAGKCRSLLARKTYVVWGDAASPTSLRMGLIANVQVAIYDKSLEVLDKSLKLSYRLKLQDYVKHFCDKSGVTRIEYRIGRKYLRNAGFETPDDVNRDIIDLWASMERYYFAPTDKVNDHKNEVDVASWWYDLPPIEIRSTKSDNVYNGFVHALHSKSWQSKYNMMRDRAYGYLSSLVVALSKSRADIDNGLNVLYRRLWRDSEEIKTRALSKYVLT